MFQCVLQNSFLQVTLGDPSQEKVRKYPFMSDENKTRENLIKSFPKETDAINNFFKLLRVGVVAIYRVQILVCFQSLAKVE